MDKLKQEIQILKNTKKIGLTVTCGLMALYILLAIIFNLKWQLNVVMFAVSLVLFVIEHLFVNSKIKNDENENSDQSLKRVLNVILKTETFDVFAFIIIIGFGFLLGAMNIITYVPAFEYIYAFGYSIREIYRGIKTNDKKHIIFFSFLCLVFIIFLFANLNIIQ